MIALCGTCMVEHSASRRWKREPNGLMFCDGCGRQALSARYQHAVFDAVKRDLAPVAAHLANLVVRGVAGDEPEALALARPSNEDGAS